jgi:apolipoprotein D and lipocalin family protein
MKKIFFLLCFAATAYSQNQPPKDLQTVSYVDPTKYIGRWYQISHNQLPFEPNKCACAQQTLGLNSNSTVSVYNSCNEGSAKGPLRDINGFATIDDPKSNAKLTVDFGLPHKGQYWIIALAEDYSWAVVSDPSRFSLYILSKTPVLPTESYQKALSEAVIQIDTSKLVITDQTDCVYP